MTDQAARYDAIADGYARWWQPRHAPGGERLLDRLAPYVGAGPARLLDVGTGIGALALGAVERWPNVTVAAIDASREMAAAARAQAERRLRPADLERVSIEVAAADELPYPDHSFDLAMSSFVFQLVPNRHRALREARRVLRPGGTLGFVTWLRDDRPWEPDAIFDELLDEVGFGDDEPEEERTDGRSDDFESASAAAAEMRRAGFRDVTAIEDEIDLGFDVESYIGFLTGFDETALFDSMASDERTFVVDGLRERLGALDPSKMRIGAAIVYAIGRRSDR
ncbi:MAG: class I SAM-dependent methyltransferase [Chloroflexota bacterium]